MKYELTNFCEIDAEAIKSYCAIHEAETDKNLGDIELVDETKLKPFTFMVGGTPCQDFSVSGTRRGAVWHCNLCGEEYNPLTVKSDKRRFCPLCDGKDISKTRSSLLVEWLRILEYIKPDVAIYENVKNILSLSFREMFDLFVEELKESEYNVYWEGLNAKDFGIPQNRERLYMVIVKKELDNGKFKFPDRYLYEAQIGDFLLENAADTEEYHNVAFCGYDEHGEMKQMHLRSTIPGNRFFQDVDGSDKQFYFRHEGNGTDVYVFEAPIDMLSYITMYKENWQEQSYVCLGGVAIDALANIMKNNENIQRVHLCVDKDEAGDKTVKRIGEELTENGIDWDRIVPENKDWNEDLISEIGQEESEIFAMKM